MADRQRRAPSPKPLTPGARTRKHGDGGCAKTAAGPWRSISLKAWLSASSYPSSREALETVEQRTARAAGAAGDRTLVATDLGHVDVLQGLPQVPPFRVLDEKAKEVDIDGLVVRVCSLEHLLEMKRSSDRAIDRVDLDALEAAQGDGRKGN